MTALSPDGRALSLYQDVDKSAQEIAAFSQKDAAKYPEFEQSLGKISKVIGDALATTPPDIDDPSRGDLWSMLKTGRAIRKLGKKDMFRLLRWGPMAVADLASEYFETELLRAVIAARGVFGTFLGPWSAGSALVLLIRAAADPHPAGSASFAAGGMGAVTQAMARRRKPRARRFAPAPRSSRFACRTARPRACCSRPAKRFRRRRSSPMLTRNALC